MKTSGLVCLVVLLGSVFSFGGILTEINCRLTDQGAGLWMCEYEVINTNLDTPAKGFDIFFDPGLYSNITFPDGGSVDQWNEVIAYDIDFNLSKYTTYGAMENGSGILPGGSVSGFVVTFSWLGSNIPQPQDYQIYDSSFDVLDSGQTVIVPEPATFLLFAGTALLVRKRILR